MAALNKENVNYNNINSVINYGKEIIKKGEDFFVDFREKSNHNNDLKYIQKLIDFARELVISAEEYTDNYFRNLTNAQDENNNYDEHFENYMFENPPKITHYVITFNIGEETLHFVIQINTILLMIMIFIGATMNHTVGLKITR